MELILGCRQSGKTTKLVESAIDWMGDNEGVIHFLGFHFKWQREIYERLISAGLVDFRFISNNQLSYALRGIGGLLVIDDFHQFSIKQRYALGSIFDPYERFGRLQIKASWDLGAVH